MGVSSKRAIVVPDLGLAARDVLTVSAWFSRSGDDVIEGDRLVELSANELTFDIHSPATGRVRSLTVDLDDAVSPGQTLGWIDPVEADDELGRD